MTRVDPFYDEFGKLLGSLRKRARMSQEGLALAVGLSRTSITNIELGRQRVLLHLLPKLARALGCSPEELIPPIEEPPELEQRIQRALAKRRAGPTEAEFVARIGQRRRDREE